MFSDNMKPETRNQQLHPSTALFDSNPVNPIGFSTESFSIQANHSALLLQPRTIYFSGKTINSDRSPVPPDQAHSLLDTHVANDGSSLKGGATMPQEIIVWARLAGLVGLIWVMAVGILGAGPHSQDNQRAGAQPEHRNGIELHEQTSQQSRAAAEYKNPSF